MYHNEQTTWGRLGFDSDTCRPLLFFKAIKHLKLHINYYI